MTGTIVRPAPLPGLFAKLTPRQRRLLKAILQEKSHREICRAARIERHEFNLHLAGLKHTLLERTKTGVVIAAVRAGLTPETL